MDEDLKIQVGLDIQNSKEEDKALLEKINAKTESLSKNADKIKLKIGSVILDKDVNIEKTINSALKNINLFVTFDDKYILDKAQKTANKIREIFNVSLSEGIQSDAAVSKQTRTSSKTQTFESEQAKFQYIQSFLQAFSQKYGKAVKDISEIEFVRDENIAKVKTAYKELDTLAKLYDTIVKKVNKSRDISGITASEAKAISEMAATYYQNGGNRSFDGMFPKNITLEKILNLVKQTKSQTDQIKQNVTETVKEVKKLPESVQSPVSEVKEPELSQDNTSKATSSSAEKLKAAAEIELLKKQHNQLVEAISQIKSLFSDQTVQNKLTESIATDFNTLQTTIEKDITAITEQIGKLKSLLSSEGLDNTFLSKVSKDVRTLKKLIPDLSILPNGNNLALSQDQFDDFSRKLDEFIASREKVQKQIEDAEKELQRKPKKSSKAAISSDDLQEKSIPFTLETKDVKQIQSELRSIFENAGKKVLSFGDMNTFDAEGNLKKFSVTVEDAEHNVEQLTFKLQKVDDGNGIVQVAATVTDLDKQIKTASKHLDRLMSGAAKKLSITVDTEGLLDTKLLDQANITSDDVNSINQAYSDSIKRLREALASPDMTQEKFLKITQEENIALAKQIDLITSKNSRIKDFNSIYKSVGNLQEQRVFDTGEEEIEALRKKYQEIADKIKNDPIELWSQEEFEKRKKELEEIQQKLNHIKDKKSQDAFESRRKSFIDKTSAELTTWRGYKNIRSNSTAIAKIDELFGKLNEGFLVSDEQISSTRVEFTALKAELKAAGLLAQSLGEKFKAGLAKFTEWFGVSQIIMTSVNAMRQMINTSKQLDKSLTDLQIASGFTAKQTKELVGSYADLAKQMGATITDVIASSDSWVRQGYSIEESNELIKNSTILAKLGQLESAEATQYLTSAMKGYGVSVEDSIGVVDKLTSVDREAAVSAGGLAEAMSRTASGAKLAGVEMNRLIGYSAVIGETTQRSMDTVGESLKSIFARMGNVKVGRLEDPETGEDLSNVETALGSVGISLRDNNQEFRNFGEVLDEIGGKWVTKQLR